MDQFHVIRKPLITEKAVGKKETERTLCFEVQVAATKTEIRQAVEKFFQVKVEEVRTNVTPGKLRRRGKFAGYRPDYKKAYVRLKDGEKVPEFAEL